MVCRKHSIPAAIIFVWRTMHADLHLSVWYMRTGNRSYRTDLYWIIIVFAYRQNQCFFFSSSPFDFFLFSHLFLPYFTRTTQLAFTFFKLCKPNKFKRPFPLTYPVFVSSIFCFCFLFVPSFIYFVCILLIIYFHVFFLFLFNFFFNFGTHPR